ncbi:hypothetical protein E2C01_075522 [Portunus trituberculatus]|uniref:Uncharacterized protein n=1 Tax=Portunus trituberculatus TaxID=210409 RepID=A0A5B7IKD9_PORTR|nr:hypothetical protein [Portunus trituberculatus]
MLFHCFSSICPFLFTSRLLCLAIITLSSFSSFSFTHNLTFPSPFLPYPALSPSLSISPSFTSPFTSLPPLQFVFFPSAPFHNYGKRHDYLQAPFRQQPPLPVQMLIRDRLITCILTPQPASNPASQPASQPSSQNKSVHLSSVGREETKC